MKLAINDLGSTGMKVSSIGLGTVKFGRNTGVKYPERFELPTDSEILNLLDCCQEFGVNFLDTAPAYGESETRLGKLLLGRRHEFIISTKVGETYVSEKSFFDYSSVATKLSIENSLRCLKTDYLDLVLVHSNGADIEIIKETPVLETLNNLKNQGLIRAFGVSSKTTEGGELAVELSDVAMVAYNENMQADQPVIEKAALYNKGILIKKSLMSGNLPIDCVDPLPRIMKFIFAQAGVSSVVVGTLNPAHLKQNVLAAINVFS